MSSATDILPCSAISEPWSHVSEFRISLGSLAIFLTMASCTLPEPWPSGRCSRMTFRLDLSTSVPMALLFAAPVMRSPSQWPGTARSSTSGGRSEIIAIGSRKRGLRASGAVLGLRAVRPLRSCWEILRLSCPFAWM